MSEDILHYGGFKIRVNGSGNLCPSFIGLDGISADTMKNIVMSTTPGLEPFVLGNFKSQRALIRLQVLDIDEYFDINRVIVYVKPLWTSFPQ